MPMLTLRSRDSLSSQADPIVCAGYKFYSSTVVNNVQLSQQKLGLLLLNPIVLLEHSTKDLLTVSKIAI
jgi:hypothetical protein